MGMSTAYVSPEELPRLQKEVLEGLGPDEDEIDELEEGWKAIEELVSGRWQPRAEASRPATGGPAVLSEQAVLLAAGEDCVDEVRHLVFRFQRLCSLSAQGSLDLGRLQNLEVLSLSHNELREIAPLALLPSLSEVNLNFNHIEDLSPLFDCSQLTKVFAARNRVASIAGLESCQQLQELSLLGNCLKDQVELLATLRRLPRLKRLELAENPVRLRPEDLGPLDAFDGRELRPATAPKPPLPRRKEKGYPGEAKPRAFSPRVSEKELPRAEELERQVELRSMELESLKAQARIKERELLERRVEHLQRRVETLEAENRSFMAVRQEQERLQTWRRRLEKEAAELEGLAEAQVTPEEDLELARWQCRCLERRLAQARSYNGQLLQELELHSPQPRSEEAAVTALMAQNAEMLHRLRADLRTAQTSQREAEQAGAAQAGAEVMTIGAGPGGVDLEWTQAPDLT